MAVKYSIIIPVFDRPNEVEELLESLVNQTFKNFDIVLVEDGSNVRCDNIVEMYKARLNIQYFYKENTGPGDSRNFGMSKATGDYMIFFDSDCIIPKKYFENLENALNKNDLDCFGGPDDASKDFSDIQKAINYAMTSAITTGGIRGKQQQVDNYQPRSFNMGFKKEVYHKVGGYSDVHPGEDPDLSYRIINAGFKVGLVEEAFVYHKRRIDFKKFSRQVYKFGLVRTILFKWYPDKKSIIYSFPSLFVLGTILLIFASFLKPTLSLFLVGFVLLIFLDALRVTKKIKVSLLAVGATFIQLFSYGYGFLKGYINLHLLKREERKAFPDFFFNKSN